MILLLIFTRCSLHAVCYLHITLGRVTLSEFSGCGVPAIPS